MCMMSMVVDFYSEKFHDGGVVQTAPPVTREEFEQLKREVLDMKELLKRAKEYDDRTGQPDCEKADKVDLLRQIAKLVGVDLTDALLPGAR